MPWPFVPEMSTESALCLQGVTRSYPQGGQEVRALDGVDVEILAGEFVAVAGPSGSGKTTLLNVAGGLDHPDQGSVRVAGFELTTMSRQELADFRLEHVGFVFQSYNLLPVLSAEENADITLLLRGVDPAERRKRVHEVLKEVGLADMEHRRPAELSGGQQQRVAVARAIVADPAIILADEPTANLDTASAMALLDLMHEMNRARGTTFLFSTHDPRILQRASRRIHLEDGRIVSDESVNQ